MDKRYVYLILAVLFCCLGCKEKAVVVEEFVCTAETPAYLENLLGSATRFVDLVVPVDSMQLATPDEGIIGFIDVVRKHPRGYVIVDRRVVQQAFLFNDDGSFAALLGSLGKGPNEYTELMDAQVGESGHIYLLSRGVFKVLIYDEQGRYVDEVHFKDIRIRPDWMRILDEEEGLFLFYNLDGDFPGPGKGKKAIILRRHGNQFEHIRSFGTPEPTLKRLFFSAGSFEVVPNDQVWIGKIFELDTEIYDLSGRLLKVVNDPRPFLPKPYLTPERLKQFDRPSKAMQTYVTSSRLLNQYFFNDFVLSFYSAGEAGGKFLLAYNYCGDLLPHPIEGKAFPLLYTVKGQWNDTLVTVKEMEGADLRASEQVVNPKLVFYRINTGSPDLASAP